MGRKFIGVKGEQMDMKNREGHNLPEELLEINKFESNLSHIHEYYAEGFELEIDSEEFMLKTYSENSAFLNKLIVFAQANTSGSKYALWINNENNSNSQLPVVIFGDEGGYHVVAGNIKELIQILLYDTEPMVDWDNVCYLKDKDHESSSQHKFFADWAKDKFNISVPEDITSIVKNAQKNYGDSFNNWIKLFVPQ